MLKITGNDVHVEGLRLLGTAGSANVNAIGVFGSGATNTDPTYVTGVRIDNNEITSSLQNGVYLKYAKDFSITNNRIHNLDYAGILALSSVSGTVTGNNIRSVIATPGPNRNAFGVALTRASNTDLKGDPRTSDVVVANNVVQDVPEWEAFDTHCGQRITFHGNVATGAKIGINVGFCAISDTMPTNAPIDVSVVGNVLDSASAPAPWFGISFVGQNITIGSVTDENATGLIAGNIVKGYGDPNNIASGGFSRGLPKAS